MEYKFDNILVTGVTGNPNPGTPLGGMISMEGYSALSVHVVVHMVVTGTFTTFDLEALQYSQFGNYPTLPAPPKVTWAASGPGVYLGLFSVSSSTSPLLRPKFVDLNVVVPIATPAISFTMSILAVPS